MNKITVRLGALIAALVAVAGIASPAMAKPIHTHKTVEHAPAWLVKGQDMNGYTAGGAVDAGIARAAVAGGWQLPVPRWEFCGVYRGVQYGLSDGSRCHRYSDLVIESYPALYAAYAAGMKPRTVLFDLETWSASKGEAARISRPDPNAAHWIQAVALLAHLHGSRIIVTLGGGYDNDQAAWGIAAKVADYVSVQSQPTTTVAGWEGRIARALRVVPAARLIAGLGTNTPTVHAPSDMRAEIAWALGRGVWHFWMNANNWGARNLCTPVQGGPGCPVIAAEVMAAP